MKLPEAVLVAGNVPIGLYESVFDTIGPGKYLKGWRYVGFSPLGGGLPNGTDAAATASAKRGCPACTSAGSVVQGPLYGLVFFNGAMTFRQVEEIANNMTCPEYMKPYNEPVKPQPLPPGASSSEPTPGAPGAMTPASPPAPAPVPAPGATSPRLPAPNPAPHGAAASQLAPKPYSIQTDAGVARTSNKDLEPAMYRAAPKALPAVAPKAVDTKKLEALEAEVFKKFDITPPTVGKRTSSTSSTDSANSNPSLNSADSGTMVPSSAKPNRDLAAPELIPETPIR